jgi:hypothetical protein
MGDKEKEVRAANEALWAAAREGDLAKVQEAHKAGGSANWKNPWEPPGRMNQFTAVHIAADAGHLDVVKYLVEKAGGDMKAKCSYGETPLEHVSGRAGKEAIQSYLKMKAAMQAALAMQKFKAAAK